MSAAAGTRWAVAAKPTKGGQWHRIGRTASGTIRWFGVPGIAARTFDATGIVVAQAWAKHHGYVLRQEAIEPYPWLVLDTDTHWPRPEVCIALNATGAALKRRLFIREGLRTHEQQQAFWNAYLARGRRPPLVAYPGTSNHEGGWAADVGVLTPGSGPAGINLGDYPGGAQAASNAGLHATVPGEPWHWTPKAVNG